MCIIEDRWITGPVGKKNALRLEREHFFRRRCRGNHRHPKAVLAQPAQDVFLDAVVIRHDPMPNWRQRAVLAVCGRPGGAFLVIGIPLIGDRRGDFAHVIHPDHPLALDRAPDRFLRRHFLRRQASLHRAARAQVAGQSACVDALDAGDLPMLQIFVERNLRTPVARDLAQFLDDKAAHVRRAALGIGGIRAVVADQRIGHRHDLSAIRRIGQHLLVAGHGSVETNLANRGAGGSE